MYTAILWYTILPVRYSCLPIISSFHFNFNFNKFLILFAVFVLKYYRKVDCLSNKASLTLDPSLGFFAIWIKLSPYQSLKIEWRKGRRGKDGSSLAFCYWEMVLRLCKDWELWAFGDGDRQTDRGFTVCSRAPPFMRSPNDPIDHSPRPVTSYLHPSCYSWRMHLCSVCAGQKWKLCQRSNERLILADPNHACTGRYWMLILAANLFYNRQNL